VLTRLSTPADAELLAEVTLASWQAAYRGLLPERYLDELKLGDQRRAWYRNLANVGFSSFLHEADGRVQGYVNLWPGRIGKASMEITALYVRPESWRKGIGLALIERAMSAGRDRGLQSAYLWVLRDNQRARSFYESCGLSHNGAIREDRSFGGRTVSEMQYRTDELATSSSPTMPWCSRRSQG
jgi:RimJ/RimL family protein N-acetyltransferase